jgi:hypothetical protein
LAGEMLQDSTEGFDDPGFVNQRVHYLLDHHGIKRRDPGMSDRRAFECPSVVRFSQGDWTPLEVFLSGLLDWDTGLRRWIEAD